MIKITIKHLLLMHTYLSYFFKSKLKLFAKTEASPMVRIRIHSSGKKMQQKKEERGVTCNFGTLTLGVFSTFLSKAQTKLFFAEKN